MTIASEMKFHLLQQNKIMVKKYLANIAIGALLAAQSPNKIKINSNNIRTSNKNSI